MKVNFSGSFNFNLDASPQDPRLAPTVVQSPTVNQSTPTLVQPKPPISNQVKFQRGAIATSFIVIGLLGIQVYAPAWNWVESQAVVKEFQRLFVPRLQLQPKDQFSSQKTPRKGDVIAGYQVTSPWGWRGDIGVPGASKYHRGTDVATPIGTSVYLVALPGERISVRCFWDKGKGGRVANYSSPSLGKTIEYLHLKSCYPGTYQAGDKIAESGDSGIGAAHLHFQQRGQNGKKEPPDRDLIEAALLGKLRPNYTIKP